MSKITKFMHHLNLKRFEYYKNIVTFLDKNQDILGDLKTMKNIKIEEL